MNSYLLKAVLISCLIFQTGCNIKLKRKIDNDTGAKVEVNENQQKSSKNSASMSTNDEIYFSKKESQIITSFYSHRANANIRKGMVRHTILSKKQKKLMIPGKIISRDIQVIPLPLKLKRRLSKLPPYVLRVQVGTYVILMKVKSREILDVITI